MLVPEHSFRRPALFDELSAASHVLVVGAGGGHDVFAGVPIWHALRTEGKDVTLGNLSFAGPGRLAQFRVSDQLFAVRANSAGWNPDLGYLPDMYLAQWLADQGADPVVYAFPQTGVQPLRTGYEQLIASTGADAIVLIDGGVDALLTGSETQLGTPAEDTTSVLAAAAVTLKTKLLVCTVFGVDAHDGVSHAQVLEAIANLELDGAFHGAISLTRHMPEARALLDLIDRTQALEPHHASIVMSSLAAALRGDFGDVHRSERTAGERLFISPLMPLYWTFDLDAVASRIKYADTVIPTQTFNQVVEAIQAFRAATRAQPYSAWPL